HVCQGGSTTVTGVGGWGSAQVTSNCSSCASVLPLGVTDLTATDQGSSVRLHWVPAGGPGANGVYYAERSTDGIDFETFASVDADMSGSYTVSDPGLIAPKLYYRVRAVTSGGATMFSQIVLVGLLAAGRFQVFPNPAAPNSAITLVVPSPSAGQARVSLIDMAGQLIGTREISLTPGDNTLSWRLRSVLAGVYFVRVQMRGGILYARLVVRPN
ncbi:MAG TPA: T9SS type A sorting domain-containing protein, partial [Puia sp.]|nr:T9SS type A sorting domain-containing protein [Puia sp.]